MKKNFNLMKWRKNDESEKMSRIVKFEKVKGISCQNRKNGAIRHYKFENIVKL